MVICIWEPSSVSGLFSWENHNRTLWGNRELRAVLHIVSLELCICMGMDLSFSKYTPNGK